jgi:transposase-like protein
MNTQIDPSRSRSINPEVKQKILEAVKNGTMKVVDAAKTYGISAKTIYHWLTQHIGDDPKSSIAYIRLLRENKALLELIGELTRDLKKKNKKNYLKI